MFSKCEGDTQDAKLDNQRKLQDHPKHMLKEP